MQSTIDITHFKARTTNIVVVVVAARTLEPPTPTCAPGTILDPDTNECVLENPPQAEEPEQSSDEGEGSQDNSNDDN